MASRIFNSHNSMFRMGAVLAARRSPFWVSKRAFAEKGGEPKPDKKSGKLEWVDPNKQSGALSTHVSAGQKVAAAAKVGINFGLVGAFGALSLACLYYVAQALIPSNMDPESIFNDAMEVAKAHYDVRLALGGDQVRPYGLGHRRRGQVPHVKYTNNEGVECIQVKFNIQGPNGIGIIMAEREQGMGANQFSYIMFQSPYGNKTKLYPSE